MGQETRPSFFDSDKEMYRVLAVPHTAAFLFLKFKLRTKMFESICQYNPLTIEDLHHV